MSARDNIDGTPESRRRQVLVRGTFGFIAGATAGVLSSLVWLQRWWQVVVAVLMSGAVCAYLAATRGDRFWERIDWSAWP